MKRTLERVVKECKRHGRVEHVLVPDHWIRKDGAVARWFLATCMLCRREYTAKYRAAHPERTCTDEIRAKDRARHVRDHEKRLAVNRAAYHTHRTERLAGMKAWHAAHPDYRPAANAAYYRLHKEEMSQYKKAWKLRNPEKVSAGHRRYESAHPEECRQRQRAREYRRRMRKGGASDGSVARYWRLKVTAYRSRCAYCGLHCRVEQDHVLPVSKGGAHVIGNVVPCCRTCNIKKRTNVWSPRPWAAALPSEAA